MSPVPVEIEGPVYKRESIIIGHNLKKTVGEKMDWAMDVTQNAMFIAVSTYKHIMKNVLLHICSFFKMLFNFISKK